MKRSLALIGAITFALANTSTAMAQMVQALSPSSVANALQSAGYRAELTKDSGGDPMIKSTSSGSDFSILFYGCTKNSDCTTVQFFAGYQKPKNGSLSSMNEFNAKNRFVRAYQADTGSARIEMDVDLDDGGMSRALFTDNLEFWVLMMDRFEKHINGN
jgi:hypothetical protein